MLNVLVLAGRVSIEPALKEIKDTKIANFNIAVDNIRKEADGTRGTTFVPVVCFNAVAENVARLNKGSRVAVKGYLQQRDFIRKDGSKGTAYECIAESVEFLDPAPAKSVEAVDQVPAK